MPKVIQSGNSLAVTIPKKFSQMVGIKKGDQVRIEKRPQNAKLIIFFEGAQQLVISENLLKSSRHKLKIV